MEQGGECAVTLRQLYDYFDRRLWESNLHKKPDGATEVMLHLSELRNAWATMLAKQNTPGTGTFAPAEADLVPA